MYDPRRLPDYAGPMFRHTFAKLVQRDTDGNLIPAWETYDKLKPGTLVQLVVFEMEDNKQDGFRKVCINALQPTS